MPDPLQPFQPATQAWFRQSFPQPTPVQAQGWSAISGGKHALLLAPTGSGKTLAAFLWAIDRLHTPRPPDAPPGVRILYVSPLKALVYDVERNLRAPLAGIRRASEARSESIPDIHVSIRTGDTPARDRARFKRHPGDILVTTPESLYLLLTSQAREALRTVETVIVDEIHAVAGTKRGVHLALTLERLAHLCETDPQRIGLSATQRPLSAIARFLGGNRSVEVVDTSEPPSLDLEVVVPIEDLDHPPPAPDDTTPELADADLLSTGVHPVSSPGMDRAGVWPHIQPKILDLIEEHRTTIVFTNSRRLCERLAQRLNELAALRGHEAPVCQAHHGSISHAQRVEIEEALKQGHLPAIVATSSLELGIDMGTVDLVVQVAAPHSVASGLQRIGRAGHGVGQRSKGRLFPKFKGDLLEAAVVARGMRAGQVETTRPPMNALDVLAQQVAAMCVVEDWPFSELLALIRRAAPFRDLGDDSYVAVLEMLAGGAIVALENPDPEVQRGFDRIRPLIAWDRTHNILTTRKGARMTVVSNAGTIPDRGMYRVHIAPDGPRVGELDEEMVYESRKGDVFLLGASSWRIVEITRDRVLVVPAPGEPGRMPFWRGAEPGRPIEMGRQLGALVRDIAEWGVDAEEELHKSCGLDALAAGNLARYVREQVESTAAVPSDRTIVVERFRDEFGDWRVCILSPFGGRVHAPWSLAIAQDLEARTGVEVQSVWSDDGIVLRFDETGEVPSIDTLFPPPEEIEERVLAQLDRSAVFAASFREAAGRALLLPRRKPGQRTPLWLQRMRAQSLLAAAAQLPGFPILLEAYRECLQDIFDLPALTQLMREVEARKVRVVEVETDTPSPFARSLVFAFVANWLYEGDAPLAERKVAALSVDRNLLRELLGEDALVDLIPTEIVAEVEAWLQRTDPERPIRHPDALEDVLRVVGDLTTDELRARSEPGAPLDAWLSKLSDQSRVVAARIAGESRWLVPTDVARYRDALGVVPPRGLPARLLQPVAEALEGLVARFARTHAWFTAADVAARFGTGPGAITPVLTKLHASGMVVDGPRPGQFCDREVFRRLKRRALAQLRGQVEPVDTATLAAFLPSWHGVCARPDRSGLSRLVEVLSQLEGCPLPWSELETRLLPARMRGYSATMLDGLCASGEWTWIGAGPIGPKDGRVRLVRRENLVLLGGVPDTTKLDADPDGIHSVLLRHLESRGASFMVELQQALGPAVDRDSMESALWDLVWDGLVSNDTLAPLRQLVAPTRRKPTRSRARWTRPGLRGPSRSASRTIGGRWWSTRPWLEDPEVGETERAHARAVSLLERYGVVGRELATSESISGGFSSIYPVLRDMEELGQVRRGWFVAGLGGAQFALPGAVDRLRAARDLEEVHVLATTDPANPYGGPLDWPPRGGTPRREAGALVVVVHGHLRLFIGKGGGRVSAWPDARDPSCLELATKALLQFLQRQRSGSLRVRQVNGEAVPDEASVAALVSAGWVMAGDTLSLEVPP